MNSAISGIWLRRAEEHDRDDLLRWRNHPDVRRFSLNPAEISRPNHEAWFARTLSSADVDLLVAVLNLDERAETVGVLRYDHTGQQATVSIYLVPRWMGRGLGQAVIEAGNAWLRRERPEARQLRAEVAADHVASRKVFTAAGFRPRADGTLVHRLTS